MYSVLLGVVWSVQGVTNSHAHVVSRRPCTGVVSNDYIVCTHYLSKLQDFDITNLIWVYCPSFWV